MPGLSGCVAKLYDFRVRATAPMSLDMVNVQNIVQRILSLASRLVMKEFISWTHLPVLVRLSFVCYKAD